MKTRISAMFSLVVSVAVLLTILPGRIMPTIAQEPEPPYPTKLRAGFPSLPNDGLYQTPDDLWVMPDGVAPPASVNSVTPQATGGPDDFGYTWDDSVAFSWVDTTGSTNTGLTGKYQQVGPIALPFNFKYYENTYNQVYISTNGTLGFSGNLTQSSQTTLLPIPSLPNNVIAPYWAPEDASTGGIYYTHGGTAPNRWWIVEWHQVRDYNPDSRLTFEVALFENGDIEFRYQGLNYGSDGGLWTRGIGIEDLAGLDGLTYTDYPHDSLAIRFTRPVPSARVGIRLLYQGRFTHAGETVAFQVPIRNTGEFGADTYDLSVSSPWPLGLYAADGTTLLTDTDSDSMVDTGSVSQGGAFTVTVKVQTPATANVGDDNTAAIAVCSSVDTSKSKTVSLRTAVPAPFAQVYQDDADGAMSLDLVQPDAQVVKKVTSDWHYGYEMAVAEMPDGDFVYAWIKRRGVGSVYVEEIEYTLLDRYGQTVRGVSKLTDHTGATVYTYDDSPTVAVAPNGNIGVLWRRYLYDHSTSTWRYLYNIYFAILDSSGNLTYGPVNLTNNSDWYQYNPVTYNVPRFYSPRITATGDNRFMLAWEGQQLKSDGWLHDIYYAVRDTNGGNVKSITKFTNDVEGGYGYFTPALAALNGNRVLLTYSGLSGIYYAVLDSGGNTVKVETSTGGYDWGPDVTQLSNGAILLAWTTCKGGNSKQITFTILDADTYGILTGPTTLNNPVAATGDDYVSVTADSAGHAILTWMDSDSSSRRNLYYALVDSNGNVLTDPTIFRTSQATNPRIETSYEGYGNTSYSWTPPSDVDGVAAFSASLFGGTPGGNAAVGVHYANHGISTASGVVLTATLDSNLTYESDTSGVVPTVSGNDVAWSLPDLGFLDSQNFTLYVQVPSGAAYGVRYPVTLTLTSNGSEVNAGDNTATAEVMVAHQIFLPLVFKNH